MADKTGIEWTNATWNPIVGCSIVSPGCTNCYAMGMAAHIEAMNPKSHYVGTTQKSKAGPVWNGKLVMAPEKILLQPLRWKEPRLIFVNSMGDLFHEAVPDEWIDKVFAVMALAPQHTFQVLTKRADRMRRYCSDISLARCDGRGMAVASLAYDIPLESLRFPLPNVWLGVSTEDQKRADDRIPDLLQTPAAVRFISAEPLLGPIDLRNLGDVTMSLNAFTGEATHLLGMSAKTLGTLDWVIVGGESGHSARPMHPDWVRSLRNQCAEADVAFFFKQWGEWLAGAVYSLGNSGGFVNHQDASEEGPPGREDHWWSGDCFGGIISTRVGKKIAGRSLDGREHSDMPKAAA